MRYLWIQNSKISDPHRLLLNPSDKINSKRGDIYVGLSNLSIYDTWKNIKKSYQNNWFKISFPTRKNKFELPDGSYSIDNIQDFLNTSF